MNDGSADIPAFAGANAPASGLDAEWLHALHTDSPVGAYHTDPDGLCVYVNARWCELTGLRAEDALGTGWMRAIHPEDRTRVATEWQQAHGNGQPYESEHRFQRPDGTVVWVFGQARRQRDAEGRVLGYVGAVTEISAQHEIREHLRRSRMALEATVADRTQKLFHMALAVEASDDAIVTADLGGNVVSWNKAAERMFGWTAAEMIGSGTERITPPELWEQAQDIKRRVRIGERVEGYETMRRTKSGTIIEVNLNLFPLRDGRSRIVGTCAVVHDMTNLRKAERRLQRLSRRLLEVQDEERRRLARELHDSAAQSVVALSMNLARLAQAGDSVSPEKRDAILAESIDLAATATRELRTTVYLLHPPLLEDRGLSAALEWFMGGFQMRSGIATQLVIEVPIERLPYRYELALFRVVQECLSNVHRHSGSATATVRLRLDAGVLTLQVEDQGRGLPPAGELEHGVGLSGMRERIAELGGTFDITSTSHGTTVTARIPI